MSTLEDQQRLEQQRNQFDAEYRATIRERREVAAQLRDPSLSESQRNSLDARYLELDSRATRLDQSIIQTQNDLNRVTNQLNQSSAAPLGGPALEIPPSSNQNTGGSSTTSSATRYQQAVADDQTRLNDLNQRLSSTNQELANLERERADLTTQIRNNPPGSAAYEQAVQRRSQLANQQAELETQQSALQDDIRVRENSLATNQNNLSLVQEGSPGRVSGPPPDPTMVADNAGQPSPSGAGTTSAAVDAPAADPVPAGEDPYVDLQDEGDNITEFTADELAREPVPAVDPYAVDQGTEAFITAELEEPPVVGRNVTTAFNPETGLYDVVDLDSGEVLAQDRSELEAQIDAAELEAGDPAALTDDDINEAFLPESDIISEPTEADAAEYGDATGSAADSINAQLNDPGNIGEREADTLRAAQNQRELRQQSQPQSGDWRVRLRLAPQSTYLYNAQDPGILKPLKATDGVIFPYTPQISTVYHANYNAYDLTHSNYRGYFYQNSYAGEVQIQATFTAQDTQEAEYLLAVIHFFRSATKMFYGGGNGKPDEQIGSPPPLVFISGMGEYQFADHPCVISQFNYNLPNDVDYLRIASPSIIDSGTDTQNRRAKSATTPTGLGSLFSLSTLGRLAGIGASPGAAKPITVFSPGNLGILTGTAAPTYVPSKLDISLVLLPMQSRQAASQQFSLRDFAAGNLLKGGFW